MLRRVILSDKAKQILCFLDLLIILVISGVFHRGIHYLQSMETKIMLGTSVVLLSVQYNNHLTCLCLESQYEIILSFCNKTANSCSMCVQNNMQVPFCRTSAHLGAPLLHWCSGCSYSKEEALHIFLWDSILCDEYVNFFNYYFFHG